MNYWELIENSPDEFKIPLIWQMPGTMQNGKTILYNGAMQILGKEIKEVADGKILIIVGKHLHLSEMGKVLYQILEKENIMYDIVSDISPEPHLKEVERIALLMDEKRYSAVVGIGGGSVMDIAKLAAHGGDGKLLVRIRDCKFTQKSVPLILLPTTSGTGSEISPYTVLTIDNKKKFYSSPEFLPTIAIIDPLLTVTMPKTVTAATAFDAMTHALEGATACMMPYTQCLAAESTALILKFLPEILRKEKNIEARYYMALASVMGMMSYVMGGGLYAHSISYILTIEKKQPHGVGCGLALPFTLAFNERQIEELLDKLCARYLGISGTRELRREMIKKIQQLFIQSGLPKSLADLGYTREDVDSLSYRLLNTYYRKKNPRKMSLENADMIFQSMITGTVQYF